MNIPLEDVRQMIKDTKACVDSDSFMSETVNLILGHLEDRLESWEETEGKRIAIELDFAVKEEDV